MLIQPQAHHLSSHVARNAIKTKQSKAKKKKKVVLRREAKDKMIADEKEKDERHKSSLCTQKKTVEKKGRYFPGDDSTYSLCSST
jgi:hypothetical protein